MESLRGWGILPLDDLLMEEEFTQRTFVLFFKFQCFFFWQIFALWQQKEATHTMGLFFGNLALSYHILRKISLNLSYLEYRFQVLGSGQTKLGLSVVVHYQY
jgi:hypothetical protein